MAISRKYYQTLRDCATPQLLLTHIQQRNKWTNDQCQLVDWEAFHITRKHNNRGNNQVVKMVHGIMPVNRQLF
eukprot:9620447-Ditylum_brightwellii.AAC.1